MKRSDSLVISKKTLGLIAAAMIYLCVSMAVFLSSPSSSEQGLKYLGVFHPILFLVTIGFIIFDYIRRGYWFNLTNFMLVLIFIYMGLGSLYYVTHFDSIPHETLKFPKFALQSFWLVCFSAVVFKVGALLSNNRFVSRIRLFPRKDKNRIFDNRIRIGIIIAFTISIIIKFIKFKAGHFGFASEMADNTSSSLTILSLLENLGYISVMVSLYYWFTTQRLTKLDKILCLSFIVILLLFALLYGMKGKVLYVILIAVIPAILVGRKQGRQVFSRKFYILVFASFAIFWALNPLIRAVMVENKSTSIIFAAQNTITSIGTGIEIYQTLSNERDFNSDWQNIYTNSIDQIWSRVSLFRYFNSVVAQTGPGQRDFRAWERYPYLPISILPRALIPDKPTNDYSAQFNLDYISNIYNSTTPSALGWAYMESGVLGILILFGVLGLLYGMIDNYVFRQCDLSVYGVSIFGVLFMQLANLEPDPYWLLNGLPHQLILLLVAYAIIFLRPTVLMDARKLKEL
ncbi:MAG: oligosaccharide repeat unit polymerase [Porticoccaceae bacterium]